MSVLLLFLISYLGLHPQKKWKTSLNFGSQVFPEALLLQLVKIMLHPDVEIRAGAHQIFSALLVPCSNPQHGIGKHLRRRQSDPASPFASIKSLLERLRREKAGTKIHKPGNNLQDNFKDREVTEGEWKQGRAPKNSPNFHKISSIFDKTTKTTSWAEAVRICFPFSLFLSGRIRWVYGLCGIRLPVFLFWRVVLVGFSWVW